jgi:uncharacterized membrane protein (DUF2068 family)
MPPTTKTKAKSSRVKTKSGGLIAIGIFKLAKALMLLAVGFGAIHFLRRDLSDSVTHWIEVLRVDPDNRYIHKLLAKILAITPKQLKELSVGTFIYAAILGTEGVGLLLRKHWAEYFTIISTGLLIPLEVYEMFHRFTWVKVLVLAVNMAIVWYLIRQVRSEKRG